MGSEFVADLSFCQLIC